MQKGNHYGRRGVLDIFILARAATGLNRCEERIVALGRTRGEERKLAPPKFSLAEMTYGK